MSGPEIVALFKDIFLAIAAIITSAVAIVGLQKWREELEGKAHFEAARNLVRATYKLREAIVVSRSPMVWSSEFPVDDKAPASDNPGREEELRRWGHVFKNRWDPVWNALHEFDAHTLEAEALWGPDIRAKTVELRQCLSTLNASMMAYMDNISFSGETFKRDRGFEKRIRADIFASPQDLENLLSNRIAQAISGIENEVRPRLRHSKS